MTKAAEGLKPCPFCGREAEVAQNRYERAYWIYCTRCGCRTEQRVKLVTAKANWNKRVGE